VSHPPRSWWLDHCCVKCWKLNPLFSSCSLYVVLSDKHSLQCQSLLAFHRIPSQSFWSTTHLITFGGGLVIAATGMIVNTRTDAALCRLRSLKKGYQIPCGYWLFDLVSCPHYLGEIVQWTGFFIARPAVVTASFVAFTASNLIPRAVQQHVWYRNKFQETYPSHRKAWLPFIWWKKAIIKWKEKRSKQLFFVLEEGSIQIASESRAFF